MFPSYLPVNAPDPGAYHFNFLGHNQKCLTPVFLKNTIPLHLQKCQAHSLQAGLRCAFFVFSDNETFCKAKNTVSI